MKVIVLNGPIGSGKDTIGNLVASIITARGGTVKMASFKTAIWNKLGSHFNLSVTTVEHLKAVHEDRVLKERPQACLYGRSTREALIFISEKVVKPTLGTDYFGRKVCDYLEGDDRHEDLPHYAIITDSGFIEELRPVAARWETYVFRLKGRGTYEGDSRRYLEWTECVEAGVLAMQDLHLEEGRPQEPAMAIIDAVG